MNRIKKGEWYRYVDEDPGLPQYAWQASTDIDRPTIGLGRVVRVIVRDAKPRRTLTASAAFAWLRDLGGEVSFSDARAGHAAWIAVIGNTASQGPTMTKAIIGLRKARGVR